MRNNLRTWEEIGQEESSWREEKSLDDFFAEEASESRIAIDKLISEKVPFDIETLRHEIIGNVADERASAENHRS